jgi:ketosteroid isomerase-like protein
VAGRLLVWLDNAALLISCAEAGRVLVAFDRATLPWHAGQRLRAGERHGGLILIPPHHSDHQRRRAGTIADRILVGRWPHMRLGQPNRLPADVAVNEGGFGSHNIELMQSALEAIHEYYKAFSTLDVKAIVSYFCEPCLTIAPHRVLSAANRASLVDSLAPMLGGLKAKGYGRSEFVQPQVTLLGETAALVQGVAVRYTTAGTEMERIPISYLMHRGGAGWKIAVLVVGS